jgi:hypothetical protein
MVVMAAVEVVAAADLETLVDSAEDLEDHLLVALLEDY